MEIIGRMGFHTKDLDPDLFIRHTLGFMVPRPEHRPLYDHEIRAINREEYEKFLISMHDEYRSQMYDQYAPNHLKFLLGIYIGIIRKKMVDYFFRNPFTNKTFLSKYAIGDEIGRGRACHIFDGIRLSDGHRIATKFIPRHSVKCWGKHNGYPVPMEIEMLHKVKEIDTVVQMLDWFEREDGWLIVMHRPMPVIPFDGYLEKHGKIDEHQTITWIREIIIFILDLASVGIMHRDLHPSNMLLHSETKHLMFLDFGNAQHVTEKYFTECDGCDDTNSPQWEFSKKWRGFPQAIWNIGQLMFTMISGNKCYWKKFEDNKRNFQINVRNDYYRLMKLCMSDNEEDRPTFEQVLNDSCIVRVTKKTVADLTEEQVSTMKKIDVLSKAENVTNYEDYVKPVLTEEEIEALPFPYIYNHNEILESWKGRKIIREPSAYGMLYIEKLRKDEMMPCMLEFFPNYSLLVDVYNEFLFDKKHIDKKILPDKRLVHYKGYKYAEPMKLYEPKAKIKLDHPQPPIKLHECSEDEEEGLEIKKPENVCDNNEEEKAIYLSPKNEETFLKLSNMKEANCVVYNNIVPSTSNSAKSPSSSNGSPKIFFSKSYYTRGDKYSRSLPLYPRMYETKQENLYINKNPTKASKNESSNSSGYASSSNTIKKEAVLKDAEVQTDESTIMYKC
uniref:non-specific serine/threonine protein kinase n=1 Tax=Parastrongyloides trichosuri TaxID=131310 RepID=A0A0N4ZAW8_PARTI